jgi:Deoxycytidine deaminase
MFRAGEFTATHVTPTDGEQVQPNGVDLRISDIFTQQTPGRIGTESKDIGTRESLTGPEGLFSLDPGGYIITYAERIAVPEEHIGFVYPRSSLLRNSCMLNTAVWDAGYEGRGEGLLQVHHPVELEHGARVAQFVLAEAAHSSMYDGSYQRERMNNTE